MSWAKLKRAALALPPVALLIVIPIALPIVQAAGVN